MNIIKGTSRIAKIHDEKSFLDNCIFKNNKNTSFKLTGNQGIYCIKYWWSLILGQLKNKA